MIKNMEYIYMVYKEHSFSKAAEKLHISQPSLSATIKKTENKFGIPIFNRKTYPISLTPFGIEYISSMEKIFEIENSLKNFVQEVDSLQKGNLSIGASSLSIAHFIPKTIFKFKQTYPNIKLHVLETSTMQSKQLLDSGTVDIIITNRPLAPKDYGKKLLYHEHLVVSVPKNNPVNKKLKSKQLTIKDIKQGIPSAILNKKGVSVAEFKDVPFIFMRQDDYLRFCSDMLFEEKHIIPNIILEVEETAIAQNFTQYGLGASIFSYTRIGRQYKNDNAVYYVINSKYAARDAFLYYKKSVMPTIAMKKFIEMITETQ